MTLAAMRRRAADAEPGPELVLAPRGFDLLAEIKRRAPSAGRLVAAEHPTTIAARAALYTRAGAAAISVLTEPEEFDGSLDDLRQAAAASGVPVMRKDFLVDPYQLFESRAAGASGALLILKLLDEARLSEMLDAAREAQQFVLIEAFDDAELVRALAARETALVAGVTALVGVNARNLVALDLDRERLCRLRSLAPRELPLVAESGLGSADDVRQVAAAGYRAALVGSALMRAADPESLLQEMIRAGRQEVSRSCACG
jgi:indole-3-glycerol phosphate synthase